MFTRLSCATATVAPRSCAPAAHIRLSATVTATAQRRMAAPIRTASTYSFPSPSPIIRAPTLTTGSFNSAVVNAAYAVRGELVLRADAHRDAIAAAKREGRSNPLPFDTIVACNIGNPHELGQRPITFFRQVLALMHYPALLDAPAAASAFSKDAIERAKAYMKGVSGGTGAYTTSQGLRAVREEVAAFIDARDADAVVTRASSSANAPATTIVSTPAARTSADDIFLTDGASSGVKMILNLLIRDSKDGVMTPTPQYPLYSASLTLFGGQAVKYYLDEEKGWGLSRSELESSYNAASNAGIIPRALVIINPGNPTGQCLSEENMIDIVKFASERNLTILADEVYQSNVYKEGDRFTSFKRVCSQLLHTHPVSLVSFHSVSKGFLGECGQRGGYFELFNVGADMKAQLVKLASISLCSNTSGQLMTGLMCNPPREGMESYSLYRKERDDILASLRRRARIVADMLNSCTGVRCNDVEGALYAFPSITLPPKAVAAAAAAGKVPDVFYCLSLLDATGICVVPGSGFGQKEGTWHFRTTILPQENTMKEVMDRFKNFHEQFMQKYA